MRNPTLQTAVTEWANYREQSQAIKPETIRNDLKFMRKFITSTGNILVRNVEEWHVDKAMADAAALAPGTRNGYIAKLSLFFAYSKRRGYTSRIPTSGLRRTAEVQRQWRHVPPSRFGQLLNAAWNKRDRAVMASAMYLFCRQSELISLKVGDLNLERGEILVTVHKSGGNQDLMPICRELDRELRDWMTTYASLVDGPMDPEWYLFPAWKGYRERRADGTFGRASTSGRVNPTRPIIKPERYVTRALQDIGYATRDDKGETLREGMHTLRRSGARALFDRLVEDSYDGALRLVMSMLHHKQSQTTEVYLGLTLDKQRRDNVLAGQEMFPTNMENVTPLRREDGNVDCGGQSAAM